MKPKYPSLIESFLYEKTLATHIIQILLFVSAIILFIAGILAGIDVSKDYSKKLERKYIILLSVTGILFFFSVLLYFFYLK